MKTEALPALQAHAASKRWWVRAAAVRALTSSSDEQAARAIIPPALKDKDYRVRYWSVWGMRRFGDAASLTALLEALQDKTPTVQLRAATVLGEKAATLPAPLGEQAYAGLVGLFAAYGDGCKRSDGDWGWRVAGMALLQFGARGKQELEQLRDQRADRRLAWHAYEALHVPQDANGVITCTEEEAVATHAKYAPPFPRVRE
jgi:HEAT repeat protein